jgi:hypothetical protein
VYKGVGDWAGSRARATPAGVTCAFPKPLLEAKESLRVRVRTKVAGVVTCLSDDTSRPPRHGPACRPCRRRYLLHSTDSESTVELAPAPDGDIMSIRSGYHDPVSTGPVSITRFVCCSCYERGPGAGDLGFFGSRRTAELHISKSPLCRGAGKGVKTITTEYRDSKRAEDQEAGPVGAPGTWPARPAGKQNSRISYLMSVTHNRTRCPYMKSAHSMSYTFSSISARKRTDVRI